jgi:hypothetical protein
MPVEVVVLRTTIMLPPDLKRRAVLRAQAEGVSLGELIRRSLESAIQESSGARDRDPLFADSEVFAGEVPADLVQNHDRYLYETDT